MGDNRQRSSSTDCPEFPVPEKDDLLLVPASAQTGAGNYIAERFHGIFFRAANSRLLYSLQPDRARQKDAAECLRNSSCSWLAPKCPARDLAQAPDVPFPKAGLVQTPFFLIQ